MSLNRKFDLVILAETRTKAYNSEKDGWQLLTSEHSDNERPNGSVAFLIKIDMKIDFEANTSRVKCYAPAESSEDTEAKFILPTAVEDLQKR